MLVITHLQRRFGKARIQRYAPAIAGYVQLLLNKKRNLLSVSVKDYNLTETDSKFIYARYHEIVQTCAISDRILENHT